MLPLLLACTDQGPIEVEPEPPIELQLEEGFHRSLTRAYGCDAPIGLGAFQVHSGLFDADGKMEVSVTRDSVRVLLGQGFVSMLDDDPCDDVFIDDGREERWLVYTSTEDAEIRILEDDGVRVYEIYDLVLEPSASDRVDVADYQPLVLDQLFLGAIVLGGTIEDLR